MSVPHRLGRYAVRRRIGAGGFATVWLAYDEQLDAPVAVKVLADNWTEDHQVRTRFVEEGRYLRRVESPHVVTVYDAGELDDGRPYLVMTYADQGTLADRLEVAGLTVAQSLEVVRQVAAGLQALHDRGIVHRDVKPANVLFRTVAGESGDGEDPIRAMVGDLGLGKALDASSRLTMIAGTPSYVAPEQAAGESPDSRADQYSLGVLTYLLLAGRTPWSHATLNSAAHPAPMPDLTEARLARLDADGDGAGREATVAAFPEAVDGVVRRALARDREQRYGSVTAYADALAAALGGLASLDATPEDRWLRADPDLTQPGARPTPAPAAGPLPDLPSRPAELDGSAARPARSRRRRLVLGLLVGVLALALAAGGAVGGWAGWRATHDTRVVSDQRDALSVTVPGSWDTVAGRPWSPPGGDGTTYSALSAGTSADWQQAAGGEGVFVGVLPLRRLPTRLPVHDGCKEGPTSTAGAKGAESRTSYETGCPGVVVEVVRQVADNRVLWVQVRSHDEATANAVLDSLEVGGV